MLDRQFWDTLPLWPTAAWPILASGIMYTLYMFNSQLQAQGVYYWHLYKNPVLRPFYLAFYMVGGVLNELLHVYGFYLVGWRYIIVLGGAFALHAVFRFTLSLLPFAQYLLPLMWVAVILAYFTYLAILDIPVLARINRAIFPQYL